MSFGFDTFYKRVSIKNKKNITRHGPVILAMNHPNTFMDPIMFLYAAYPPKLYYLARGDAFTSAFATWFFESLGIVPIFRIQDGGKEGLKKNDETYKRVFRLLSKDKKIMIFAEGLCIQERRLRPLKKGVPRMVFGGMEAINDPDLAVVPIGINYTDPKKFRSNIFFNVGEPIMVSDFMADYKAQPARTQNAFLKVLEPKMKELIIHINNPENDKLIVWLEELFVKDHCKQQNLNYKNTEHEFIIGKQITEAVNKADEENKEVVNSLNEKCKTYFEEINKFKIRDWLIDPNNNSKVNWFNFLYRTILLIVFAPLCIRGILGNYLPYKISQKISDAKIKEVEFHAAFNLVIGTVLTWIFYTMQFCIAYSLAPNIGWPALVIVVSFFTGKFVLHYYPFFQKTIGLFRVLTNKQKANALKKSREEICSLFAQINKN